MEIKKNILREKSFVFSIRIVNLYKFLVEEKKEYILSKQIMRSGTNPGAMVREAANAESGADFIHKLSIAQKEIDETIYWLELLFATNYLTESQFESLNNDAVEIIKLIKSSIITRRKNLSNA
jgi:four helix bundle protein